MTRRRRRGAALLSVGALMAAACVQVLAVPAARAATSVGAFSKTVTLTRTHLVDGKDQVADSRTVTLTVDRTKGIRDRDGLVVTWTGAHPTSGLVNDPTSDLAPQEEYPMVLLECRGVDSSSAPSAQQLTPQTCWTQSPRERYVASFSFPFPSWRVDRYATAADRAQYVGAPDPRPAFCGLAPSGGAEYFLHWKTVDTTYYGGTFGCAGIPPEASISTTNGLPGNDTYGQTGVDGKGSARFDVRTAESNASLGCSTTVPCSLVAIPIMGISCDVAAAGLPAEDVPTPGTHADQAFQTCSGTGNFKPGQRVIPQGNEDVAVSGLLWWSASNWRNRITVPLGFAPLGNVCDLNSASAPLNVYGSELMIQATTQWAPKFCLSRSLFPFKHVQTGEPQAASLLKAGTIEAALTSRPPDGGWGRPVATAPIGVTGFAIAFAIDDQANHPVTTLRLDARLLAKLLTESYPAIPAIQSKDAPLSGNPLDMSQDPEFIALNPGIQHGVPASFSASTLLALSSDSDVMHALTQYITIDPDARAWLNGAADPWGMVVNPAYKDIALPVQTWPLLDTFEPTDYYTPDLNDCLHNSPVPFLPLVASPVQRLTTIALDMQYSLAPSQVVCDQPLQGQSDGEKLVALGRQAPGFRFMVGVMSLADAARFGVSVASLQTHVLATTPAKFTSATGRTFVAPSPTSLRAAAKLLVADPATRTWDLGYSRLLTDPSAASAYPGTMVVYANVLTRGLPAKDARQLAALVRYMAGPGQTPGTTVGTLPAGYLPMTAANGLGALAAYAQRAASAVSAQTGAVPSLTGSDSTGSNGGSSSGGGGGGGGGAVNPSTSGGGGGSSAGPSASATPTTSIEAVSLGTTKALDVGPAGLVLPVLLVLAVLFALVGGFEVLMSVRGKRS